MKKLMTARVRRGHQHPVGGDHVWDRFLMAFSVHAKECILAELRFEERQSWQVQMVERSQAGEWFNLKITVPIRMADPEVGGPVGKAALWSRGRMPSKSKST